MEAFLAKGREIMDAAQALEILKRHQADRLRKALGMPLIRGGITPPKPTDVTGALDFVINNWGE